MGYITALGIAETETPLISQIQLHLVSNFYPPIPAYVAQSCVDAIEAYMEEDYDRLITLPDGVLYRGSPQAPAHMIVEQHRLGAWITE